VIPTFINFNWPQCGNSSWTRDIQSYMLRKVSRDSTRNIAIDASSGRGVTAIACNQCGFMVLFAAGVNDPSLQS
jgi:predicted RNA-binding Zn-ribbon protein involved in translation (DUF1610 family)